MIITTLITDAIRVQYLIGPAITLGSIDKHTDVDTTTVAPVLNDVLTWDGTNWVPDASGGGGGVTSVTSANADLTVANTNTTPVITLVQTPAIRSATTTINVSSATAPTSGQVLTATGASAATWQTPSGGGLTVGTTNITSGTTTRILYNNAGTLGEYTLTGSGTVVAMQNSPTFTTPSFTTSTTTTAITATTASNDIVETLINNSSGTPAAGYGLSTLVQLKSTTTDSQTAGKQIWSWTTATHASRQSSYAIQLVGAASVGNLQDAFKIDNNGNSFQFKFINHAGFDPKLSLYSGTTVVNSWEASGADMYFSTINSATAKIYFRPGVASTILTMSTTGLFIGGSTAPTALCHIAAGTTAKAQIKFESSTAPTSPNNGDLWFDGTDLKLRVAGATYTLTKV